MRSESRPRFQLSVTDDDRSAEKGRVEDQVESGLPVGSGKTGRGDAALREAGALRTCGKRWRRVQGGSLGLIVSAADPRIGQLPLKSTLSSGEGLL